MDKLGEVYFLAGEIIIQMEQWMKHRDGHRTKLNFNKLDKVRLLRLRTWSMRHHLSVWEILDMIVAPMMERVRFKKKYGFDLTIKVLTGHAARKMLHFQISKAYPDDEHIHIWREHERQYQLQQEKIEAMEGIPLKPRLYALKRADETVDEFIERYSRDAAKDRDFFRKAAAQKWRRRMRYRGNPWL